MADLYYNAPIPEPVGSAEELAHKPPAQRERGRGARNSSVYRIDFSRATPEHYRRWRAHYYANITLIDEGIGKILSALESAGVLEETLIIFTSDHGDALGDHGLSFKTFFFDSMVRVPLIVRGPGVPRKRRSASLVSTLDLIPLIYRTCGVAPPETLQGVDISPLLQNPSACIRDAAFSEIEGRTMVMTDRYKYARYRDGSAELYDRNADPDEVVNLSGDSRHAETERDLMARLLDHSLDNQTFQATAVGVPQNPIRVALEEEYRNKMRHRG